jgi:NAD(P)-dependent dehydrogenase (short-subunit alcohol dehydrogenase family)
VRRVMVLGGYGNFGKRIAAALVRHQAPVVIAGRNREKAQRLAEQLKGEAPGADIQAIALDAETGLDAYLAHSDVAVVVNTCGPFQDQDYHVAETCIRQRIHSIDLADGRAFVTGIGRLDAAAKAAGISVISGASTVPGLTSAVVEYFKAEFAEIDELVFGIAPGQKAERGLATTAGILSYVGKPLKPAPGDHRTRYGWQDIYRQDYPGLGARWMANCDIPDLDLLPPAYGIRSIHFSAGMENPWVHFGVWSLSWLVRMGLPLELQRHAAFLLRISHRFDRFGSDAGGMHMILKGRDLHGRPHERQWFIIASNGDGPQIPCVPAILLAKQLAEAPKLPRGAMPCVGLVRLEDYLGELARFSIAAHQV